jgi:hypothetical protein
MERPLMESLIEAGRDLRDSDSSWLGGNTILWHEMTFQLKSTVGECYLLLMHLCRAQFHIYLIQSHVYLLIVTAKDRGDDD